jgi:hypothetical protein
MTRHYLYSNCLYNVLIWIELWLQCKWSVVYISMYEVGWGDFAHSVRKEYEGSGVTNFRQAPAGNQDRIRNKRRYLDLENDQNSRLCRKILLCTAAEATTAMTITVVDDRVRRRRHASCDGRFCPPLRLRNLHLVSHFSYLQIFTFVLLVWLR